MRVIAIDPGVMTGYCYARVTPENKVEFYPFQMMDDVDDLWNRLHEFKPRYIIIESFEFRGGHQRAATGIEYFPIQLIGVARLYELAGPHQCGLYLQNPAQGKGYYSNTVLKKRGLIQHGMFTKLAHGIDATRHLLQWFTFGAGYKYIANESDFAVRLDEWE
ncbi:MAG TPA: hypothetical protein VGE97_02045 [Nitrososphaera sp.]|jgi:hypothetical protein